MGLVKIQITSNDIPLTKTKFKIDGSKCVAFFIAVLRKQINVRDSEALFIFWDKRHIYNGTILLSEIHTRHNRNGILYVHVSLENAFGYKSCLDYLFDCFCGSYGRKKNQYDYDIEYMEKIISDYDREWFRRKNTIL